ncbi:MAG: 2-amino-3,7-dideoxy-D-threo-hept-6-ulosonate synthase [Nitrososphaerales archaeon]
MPRETPSPSSVGKQVRLGRIFRKDDKSVIFAMDHGIERGPDVFPTDALDPKDILRKVVEAGFDAIMVSKGVAKVTHGVWKNELGLVVKLTGKTELRSERARTLQSPIATVGDALALGADAVAVTVYWGSKFEDAMLERLTKISKTCDFFGVPLMQLAYPRVESGNNYDPKIVSYASRLAMETGADAIKTYFTGDRESFSSVVKAAGGVPVLLSGGETTQQPIEFLSVVEDVMAAGAKGVVVGRNVFQHKDPVAIGRAVIKIVHEGLSAKDAAKLIR